MTAQARRQTILFATGDQVLTEQLIRGARDYAKEHGLLWYIRRINRDGATELTCDPDGVMGFLVPGAPGCFAGLVHLPQVQFSYKPATAERCATVHFDDQAIGRLAAEHLIGCGYRHFIAWGRHYADQPEREERYRAFAASVEAAGFSYARYAPRSVDQDEEALEQLGGFLERQEQPIGSFGFVDRMARWHLDGVRLHGHRIGPEVGVLGVGNDIAACEACEPPLSSIALPWIQMGYEGARLMHQMLCGAEPPPRPLLCQPLRVVARQSTDRSLSWHPLVQRAWRLIVERPDEAVQVEAVAKLLGVSRATLQRHLRASTGMGYATWSRQLRLDAAVEALLRSDEPIRQIAEHYGFPTRQRFASLCRERFGRTPSELRNQA